MISNKCSHPASTFLFVNCSRILFEHLTLQCFYNIQCIQCDYLPAPCLVLRFRPQVFLVFPPPVQFSALVRRAKFPPPVQPCGSVRKCFLYSCYLFSARRQFAEFPLSTTLHIRQIHDRYTLDTRQIILFLPYFYPMDSVSINYFHNFI